MKSIYIETESIFVFAEGWGREGMETDHLMGMVFSFGVMKMF